MTQGINKKANYSGSTLGRSLLPILFFVVAVAGLFYVKWNPYYFKALSAAAKHTIGNSIITGKAAVAPEPSWSAAWGYALAYFTAVWKAVILGLLLGSLVQVLIPRDWVKRLLGSDGVGSTVLGGASALPGMMCSCCAAPVAVGLRKSSASVGSALAFFLASPVLNPATIVFMGFVLSWKFALLRVVIGVILVFGIAAVANRLTKGENILEDESAIGSNEPDGNLFFRWMRALGGLIIDTIPAYVIVVFLLGAARAWLFPVIGGEWSNSFFAILGLSLAGTLFVIPTAAEIPIVQTLMSFGLGVGPAAALLITLPAVSLPSLLIIKRAFPTRILAFVALSVLVLGIAGGVAASLLL